MRISVLGDGPSQAAFICQTLSKAGQLSKAGHLCHSLSERQAFVHLLLRQTFDLLVLAWNVPDMPGGEALKEAGQNLPPTLPMLFMTSLNYETDIVSILNAGANDYIVEPVSAQILLARVETLLRHPYRQPVSGSREQFGGYTFDSALQPVQVRGTPASLTNKAFELALLLFRNLARPLSRSPIFEHDALHARSGAPTTSKSIGCSRRTPCTTLLSAT
ncbi:response regulator transcription factor [Mycetohabitans sp. B46]|uniref:response regulator transcription factor n=1 Tax=Mycetohabitans sp. B46 TaxID=2772536 RepID=UPI00307D17E9